MAPKSMDGQKSQSFIEVFFNYFTETSEQQQFKRISLHVIPEYLIKG